MQTATCKVSSDRGWIATACTAKQFEACSSLKSLQVNPFDHEQLRSKRVVGVNIFLQTCKAPIRTWFAHWIQYIADVSLTPRARTPSGGHHGVVVVLRSSSILHMSLQKWDVNWIQSTNGATTKTPNCLVVWQGSTNPSHASFAIFIYNDCVSTQWFVPP